MIHKNGDKRSLFLPVSRYDMELRGWDELDFLFISGDAYVDHPSFAASVISRVLESKGYKVGIVPQPDWRTEKDFLVMGRPKLGVLVSAGNLDSMLGKLTANKKTRSSDAYSPGGKCGMRPDRATLVYCQMARKIWGDIPIITGSVEASLRRFVHYDYWSDSLRRSILLDSQADILIYGMGERQIVEIADKLKDGIAVRDIRDVHGTCFAVSNEELSDKSEEQAFGVGVCSKALILPSWDEITADKRAFAEAYRISSLEQDPIRGKTLLQLHEKKTSGSALLTGSGSKTLVQLPPAMSLTEALMDEVYDLPYVREAHPMYDEQGGVPALTEVKFSITSHRGCFGSCSFCAIHAHQGRIIQARSHASILREVGILAKLPDFKGYIHDIGGPTANFRHPACTHQAERGVCKGRECLFPEPCKELNTSHEDFLSLLRKCRAVPGVKKVFVRSGLRYDYLLADKQCGIEFLEELCEHHISGQLKVAPEHASPAVLRHMRKGSIGQYKKFMELYDKINNRLGKKQYLVPYFITSHPGTGLKEAIELAEFAASLSFCPEQAQDFIPTPGSLSTCMYWTGLDPFTGKEVYTPKTVPERKMQKALLQHRMPQNRDLVLEALKRAGKMELVKALLPGAVAVGAEKGQKGHSTSEGVAKARRRRQR